MARYTVECQAFDAAAEWQALLPADIIVEAGRPIDTLLASLRADGVECRLVKTSRSGTGESYLLDRRTEIGNSQAAIILIPVG